MKKVLIANRGEIAVRVIRACQELGLKTVAIHSSADKDSLHAKLADESVCIGPGPSINSYLHIPAIMSAAEITGVDAIHPGYGFLAESADFAKVCAAYNIKFIGPTPEQIRSLGDKVEARRLAIESDVPLLPGSKGIIKDNKDALNIAQEIGYPCIIKAAAGGGGRGMKIAHRESELIKQLQLAQKEALACFGNPDCFIERYLTKPRHVEVQIVADEHGNIAYLGERDCSIQRRHQKLVEESPCLDLSEELRKKVGNLAINLAKVVNYQSLGTAEFLYQDGQFYFMEMNTRVQVEHPVTEMVMAVDLIKEQILIAQGKKLTLKSGLYPRGHAIECRINAEDPKTFAPWPGIITGYHEPGGPGIRIDSMIYKGYRVPSLYDSMIAKVIAFGGDRMEAIYRMRRALREMKVEGIRTNIPFHLKLLEDPNFIKGDIHTNFLSSFSL
ncbi:MAG: acetyl-CoA carboxylase biotin carboxylase subunit [Oligoflexales bacterium]